MSIHQPGDPRKQFRQFTGTSRRALLRGAAIGGIGLAFGSLTAVPALADDSTSSAPMSESLQTIINIALTAELLAVTFLGNGIANLGLTGPALTFAKAAQAEEQLHANNLELLGAQPLAMSFSFSPSMFTDVNTFLSTAETLETAFVAAYLIACREAAAAGLPDVAQLAARTGCVEAEHRALVRSFRGEEPPNNSAFESLDGFSSVSDAAAALTSLGLLNPGGAYAYPGPVAIDYTGVIDQHP